MIRALDDIAASASSRVVAWTASCVDESRREWVDGMASELSNIEGGWRKLRWAIEGVPLAWAFAKPTRVMDELQSRRTTMNDQQPATWRSVADSFVLNIAMLVGWWLAMSVAIRMIYPKGLTADTGEMTILTACIIGLIAAVAFRRLGAAYALAGFVAFGVIEGLFHSMRGVHVVQGGPAHFANMTAGILAATFSALIENRRDDFAGGLAWSMRSPIAPLMTAGFAARRKFGYAAHLLFAVFSFCIHGSRDSNRVRFLLAEVHRRVSLAAHLPRRAHQLRNPLLRDCGRRARRGHIDLGRRTRDPAAAAQKYTADRLVLIDSNGVLVLHFRLRFAKGSRRIRLRDATSGDGTTCPGAACDER